MHATMLTLFINDSAHRRRTAHAVQTPRDRCDVEEVNGSQDGYIPYRWDDNPRGHVLLPAVRILFVGY